MSASTKDGTECKSTRHRSLIASFERHLKKKGYSDNITNEQRSLFLKEAVFYSHQQSKSISDACHKSVKSRPI